MDKTFETKAYGTISFNLWQGKRLYINGSLMRRGIGYIDLTTNKVVSTCGNYRVPYQVFVTIGLAVDEEAASDGAAMLKALQA